MQISLKEPRNFVKKYLLKVKLLIFKNRWQNISVSVTITNAVTGLEVTFVDRTTLLPIGLMKTVQLLTRETPDFIAPTFWYYPVDYRIWGMLQERVYSSQIYGVAQLKSRLSKSGNVSTRWSVDHRWSSQLWRSRLHLHLKNICEHILWICTLHSHV